jgi:hypothetical protein
MPLVLTSCTNRKRFAPPSELTARSVRPGDLRSVAREWRKRVKTASVRVPIVDLYCGRAFRQAEAAATEAKAGFFVVSAGLGLLSSSACAPSYSLTITPGAADNVLARISGLPTPAEWWRELSLTCPLGSSISHAIGSHRGPIMLALSATYLAMVADDLAVLPSRTRARLRVFTLTPASMIVEPLRPYVMPYDGRFDGSGSPIPGTRGDFAQRSLAHFVATILSRHPKADFDGHAEAAERLLAKLRPHKVLKRTKQSDAEITALIHRHWDDAHGQSSRMLRYLRDNLGIACEQGRFRNLFLAARDHREHPR